MFCSLAALVLGATVLQADDWPQWRGPGRTGISTETRLLKSWPAGGPPLVWKARGLGPGYASVSVVKDRIYTMGDGPNGSSVRALQASDGKILWSTRVGKPGEGGGYPGPRCTPTVAGSQVFALGQAGELVCVEAEDGREVWRKDLDRDLGGSMMSGWGYSESVLVDGEQVICTPGGRRGTLAALNRRTGAVLWRSAGFTDSAAYASVLPITLGNTKQYVQLTDAHVAGFAPADGRLLWKAPRKGATAVIPTPIHRDGLVYVTSGYGVGCNLFRVTGANNSFSAVQVYANKTMVNHHGGVILIGDHLYGYSDGKGWVCQDFRTGATAWAERGRLGKGSLTYADGHFYLRAEDGKGTVVLIEATPAGWSEKGRFDQPDRSGQNSWPHPSIANGRLYLRDQDVLLCYGIRP